MKGTPAERFLAKVNKTAGCWLWTGAKSDGYGSFYADGHVVRAHRWAYEQANGPIPVGLVIDHMCRVRSCVRPSHLRAVTQRENVLAPGSLAPARRQSEQTHCLRGHPLAAANVWLEHGGRRRRCKVCTNARRAARRARLRLENEAIAS